MDKNGYHERGDAPWDNQDWATWWQCKGCDGQWNPETAKQCKRCKLRRFYIEKLGWAPEYLNDMMRPVLDSMKGHRSGQTTLVDWVEGRAGVYRSARLRRAAEAIRQSRDKDIVESAQDPES